MFKININNQTERKIDRDTDRERDIQRQSVCLSEREGMCERERGKRVNKSCYSALSRRGRKLPLVIKLFILDVSLEYDAKERYKDR